jgi:hypothetical protein
MWGTQREARFDLNSVTPVPGCLLLCRSTHSGDLRNGKGPCTDAHHSFKIGLYVFAYLSWNSWPVPLLVRTLWAADELLWAYYELLWAADELSNHSNLPCAVALYVCTCTCTKAEGGCVVMASQRTKRVQRVGHWSLSWLCPASILGIMLKCSFEQLKVQASFVRTSCNRHAQAQSCATELPVSMASKSRSTASPTAATAWCFFYMTPTRMTLMWWVIIWVHVQCKMDMAHREVFKNKILIMSQSHLDYSWHSHIFIMFYSIGVFCFLFYDFSYLILVLCFQFFLCVMGTTIPPLAECDRLIQPTRTGVW